jgi:hypothetical protein
MNQLAAERRQLISNEEWLLVTGASAKETSTVWQNEFIVWLAGHDQNIFGVGWGGWVGFDVDEIAWEQDRFDEQKAFVLKVIDTALRRHRWEILDYDPPYVHLQLGLFRTLIEKYAIDMVQLAKPWAWWGGEQGPMTMCPKHEIY